MAFPSTPLDIRTDLQLAGVWTNISGDVYVRDPKIIDVGRRDQGTRTDPGSLSLTINNAGGKYSPRNPVSPLYGLIGRNSRVRVSVPGTVRYLDLTGASDSYASTPDAAPLDITGDLDVRWEGEASWYAAGARTLIGKWETTGDQRSYLMRIQDGQLYLSYSTDGTAAQAFAHFRPLPTLPRRAALRATLDVDNGTGGRTVLFYWAPSLAGPWTPFGTTSTLTGTITVFSGTAPLTVAPTDLTASTPRRPLEGRVYGAEVRSGIGGSAVANPDFSAQTVGATGFTDGAGRAWTLTAAAAITDREPRFVGEIASWPTKWQPDGSDVWTTVEAAGILRRYGQGAKPLDSTLRRRIPSGAPIAYWPMEEEREATRAYSPIKGVSAAALTGVEFGAVDTLPSSRALPRLSAAATLSAIVPTHADPGQWQVEFVYNADDKAPPGAGDWAEVIGVSTTGTVRRWVIGMRAGAARIYGFDASGTDVIFRSVGLGSDVFHGWVRMRFWARANGSAVDWRLDFQDVGGDAGGLGDTLAAATPGRVTAVTATWGALTEGWALGHLSVLPTAANGLYTGSDNGYAGETAWQRMLRLANEEGIPLGRSAGPLTPERVGPQRPETLLSLLEAAAEVDGGLLLEDRARVGLVYRDRSTLYTQDPALTLAYDEPGLAYPLEPVDDDEATRNDRTITREGGSSARAVLEEGRLSVQDPPDGIGLYDDAQTLALDDDVQPEMHAFWQLHLGTYDGARFPAVSVMLHKAPALIPAVLALREGDVIRLTGLPPWVSYDDVDLIVQGWHEVIDLHKWDITFNCSPGGPWNTAVADHAVYGKADTDGCELLAAATSTATELDVVSAGLPWTEDPVEMPILLRLGGEVVETTAVAPLADSYTRTVSNGWGTASSGLVWATAGGAASERSVDGARGVVTLPSSVSSIRFQHLVPGVQDCEVRCRMQAGQVSTGASIVPAVLLRYVNTSTYYRARLHFAVGGEVFLSVTRDTTQVGGTPQLSGVTYTPSDEFELRVRLEGHRILMRAWKVGAAEPSEWQHDVTITSNTIAEGAVGLSCSGFAGNTNTSPLVRFDAFEVVGGQRLTVTRSVNRVVKAHAVGTAVRLAHPAIASL
ncbi:hypothetical protein [Streptomyces spectabilis]|uniref:Uncharacterized protein n=1 Tax=Streptomyces spectabilis TaxID=68270 RepID=A0A5P2X485_STRST|nr:hypothetical protein [Streptomyces spectabilis]MBB5103300.1 hypothetical protein [Streptomyces spectabilis]MCI3902490.1 hypothetical protein [Streptomyces spectabilis]QEV59827.1 hypothetical protein CP982_14650 [Streptomyces spectabilis]GGV13547.1 hypothetical protein GCM10010245_23640 [Streptomyces spectabilis]